MYPKQALFLESQSKYTAFVGGIRSGKTTAGGIKSLMNSTDPGSLGLVLGPTFPQLRDSTLRSFRKVAGDWLVDFHKTEMLATLWNGAQLIFRSADNPDSTRGISASYCWMDEAAYTLEDAYRVALGRLSENRAGQGPLFITTTPNGMDNWVYTKFVQEAPEHPDRRLIQASTEENIYLPPAFVQSLKEEYVGEYALQELQAVFTRMGGTLFQRSWFTDQLEDIPLCTQWARYWDLAVSASAKADWTVGALVGRTSQGLLVIADIIREHLEWPDAQELIIRTALEDGPSTLIGVEQVAFQLAAVQELQRREELLGYTLEGERPDRSKYQRAMAWASKAKAGIVKVARRGWTPTFIGELASFTGQEKASIKDDQVDAVGGAIRLLGTSSLGVYIPD